MLERVLEKVLEKIRYWKVREGREEGKKMEKVVEYEPKEVKGTEEEDIERKSRRLEARESAGESALKDKVARG